MPKVSADLNMRLRQLQMLTVDELLDFHQASMKLGNTTNARRIEFVLKWRVNR